MSSLTPGDKMIALARLQAARDESYGANYNRVGAAMEAFFPDGVRLRSADDFTRYHILTMMVAKIGRYAFNFERGGHYDSLDDLAVYAAILSTIGVDR